MKCLLVEYTRHLSRTDILDQVKNGLRIERRFICAFMSSSTSLHRAAINPSLHYYRSNAIQRCFVGLQNASIWNKRIRNQSAPTLYKFDTIVSIPHNSGIDKFYLWWLGSAAIGSNSSWSFSISTPRISRKFLTGGDRTHLATMIVSSCSWRRRRRHQRPETREMAWLIFSRNLPLKRRENRRISRNLLLKKRENRRIALQAVADAQSMQH